ncbi:hypothetical protein Tco_1464867 [Tanacetum coccineum]
MKARQKPRRVLKGLLGDKDSGENIPPTEPINPTNADLSGTSAKYQVDETQSTRLRYQSLPKNKGKTFSEVQPDTESLQLQTFFNIQAYLLSKDELDKESAKEESEASHVQESTSDSSSPDLKKFDNTLPLIEIQLIKYLRKMLRVLFSRITENQWEQHEEAAVSYANLKASIEHYYDENIAYRYQTNKLVEASMSSLDKSSTTISDLYKGLDVITQLLKDITNAVKDDPATNKKIEEATKTFTKISSQTIKILSLVKDFDFTTLQSTVKNLQDHALKQEEASATWTKQDILEIKSMMMEIYEAFKDQSSSVPSGSVTPTLAITHIPISSIKPTQAQQIISTTPESPQASLRMDKGKGIATESDKDPSNKLVPASIIVRPDPDEEVKVPYTINGKMYFLTGKEMQAYLDKEELIKKAEEEARLIAMSKPEVIKVVQKEVEKIGLDLKKIASAKAGEKFKKAQEAEH